MIYIIRVKKCSEVVEERRCGGVDLRKDGMVKEEVMILVVCGMGIIRRSRGGYGVCR